MTIASATAQLSEEQRQFLERKARESRSPAPVEVRFSPAARRIFGAAAARCTCAGGSHAYPLHLRLRSPHLTPY